MKFKTEQELLDFTKNIEGKKFKEIDKKNLLKEIPNDKGLLGKIVEYGFYGYEPNNNPKSDFEELGIELKVSGYRKNKKGDFSAKERLVLSMIDYNQIIYEDFLQSQFWSKNKKLLIIWYEFEEKFKKDKGEFRIDYYQLYDMKKDVNVIKNDFDTIRDKVIKEKADELGGRTPTTYLGACKKGKKGTDIKKYSNKNLEAAPRAFELKNSFMTAILRNFLESHKSNKLTTDKVSPYEYVYSKIEPYFGENQLEIAKKLEIPIEAIPKNINKQISNKIIGTDKFLNERYDIFEKTYYAIKNVPVDNNMELLERLSFRNLKLEEFESDWEDSIWKSYFEDVIIILILYQGSKGSKNGERILKDVKEITFTEDDLKSFENAYEMIQKTIETQNIENLPVPEKSYPLVIAPRGKKGDNAYGTFLDKNETKTCFMLSKDFVNDKLKYS
ncbi:type-2 restriction enzyme Sau3AI [Methanobrevibacter cuticularis]|uniref:Type-2 restriction enzyme Sau3AI n=1 Tax=Methanobrevibacter cuticularis TaxID=47311 RepID=A0A166CHJ8_9EURY|nr:Sau3AI family type II restriction endonuclease [Methanobrevibacter cuticularis]KZX14516.1 type-2 restriction enzyme Sau3AI [Methanobrevibacter cuticularis]